MAKYLITINIESEDQPDDVAGRTWATDFLSRFLCDYLPRRYGPNIKYKLQRIYADKKPVRVKIGRPYDSEE